MKLFIGGACQGKRVYAETVTGITEWIDGNVCEYDEIYSCKAMTHFHMYVRRCMEEKKDVSELAEHIIERNPDVVLVANEIGYGVVPVEAFERNYRETFGRICTKLAAYSSEVHRVVCGLGTVIKHD
ncbi:MAG: bifunctional adenosylcobinamide kinase/adenosylcobinamide-phosphate guanylyltransferase [Lachnospiraceae bacterium]|nr:bifunctional adenosylcobinamide kinase/adenosylcobinamide-phosphate guanylyltransferase [Lachnospiraceae bacterium]